MNAMLARDELIERVNHMSDEQVASLLEFIRVMQLSQESHTSHIKLTDYDESKDPMVQGLFSGPSDLASRTKSILQEEFGQRKHDTDDKP